MPQVHVAAERRQESPTITGVSVRGYKSFASRQNVDFGALTLLAGANSGGKSSIMQALLLLKQTLEARYDAGALLINGPNVRFSESAQMFSSHGTDKTSSIEIGVQAGSSEVVVKFQKPSGHSLTLARMQYTDDGKKVTLSPRVSQAKLRDLVPFMKNFTDERLELVRDRCFFALDMRQDAKRGKSFFRASPAGQTAELLSHLIHIPGLRGNPERTYPVTSTDDVYPGVFQDYVASILSDWQAANNDLLNGVAKDLAALELTSRIEAKRVNDTEVEIKIGRTIKNGRRRNDLVSIADAGFGVSQVLPVIVALHAAKPEHLVYVEQPEIHLHPRARVALAGVLVRAVQRGVRCVIETHSSILLLAIQREVARQTINGDCVRLHWFTRDPKGDSRVSSANLDLHGSFGEWPEDFGDVSLELESTYLDELDKMAS